MTITLYMDHHVPAAITEGLRRRNVDVLTAQEDGATTLDDDSLLARTTQLDRVLFSQDRDLLIISNQWVQSGQHPPNCGYANYELFTNVTSSRSVVETQV